MLRGMPDEARLFLVIAILANVFLTFAALRWIGGGNLMRAIGSQVLTIPNRRIPRRGLLGGVVAGLAYKNRWPLGRARAIALVLWFLSAGLGALHYLALCRYLPSEESAPWDFDERTKSGGASKGPSPTQAAGR